MSGFKHEKIPSFTKRDGNALVYNGTGNLQYCIPENYFTSGYARVEGAFVRLLGSFMYRINTGNKPSNTFKTFSWATVFLCRPSSIDKVKETELVQGQGVADYRILTFEPGDQLVTNVFTPQNTDNVNEILSLHVKTGKIPNTIPYNELYNYIYEAINLNGGNFNIHSQIMGIIYSKICRDPDDIYKPFRMSKAIDKDMRFYKCISVIEAARYISPFAALMSVNFDDAVVSSVVLSDDVETGKRESVYSPLEQVLTM
jgi:hypothetical protein